MIFSAWESLFSYVRHIAHDPLIDAANVGSSLTSVAMTRTLAKAVSFETISTAAGLGFAWADVRQLRGVPGLQRDRLRDENRHLLSA